MTSEHEPLAPYCRRCGSRNIDEALLVCHNCNAGAKHIDTREEQAPGD